MDTGLVEGKGSTELQVSSKRKRLPVERWKIELSNKNYFLVDDELKKMIMNAPTQLVELPCGRIINKAYIVCIDVESYARRDFTNYQEM